MQHSIIRITATALLPFLAADASAAPRSPHRQAATADDAPAVPELTLADRELAAWQDELLELAYSAVSAMPLRPHIKNRSRAQERVVIACFELDQPRRAARYLEDIANWRQGTGYADLAFYAVEKGEQAAVIDGLLARAHELANPPVYRDENGEEVREQAWRLDRIKAKIARVLLTQGREDEAAVYEADLTESESGKQNDVRVRRASDEDFDQLIARLVAVGETGHFDLQKNEIEAQIGLYDRFYDDDERREEVERTLTRVWAKFPIDLRISYLLKMAEYATGHEDPDDATRLIDRAEDLAAQVEWSPRNHPPVLSQLARARFGAGQVDAAAELARAAWVAFDSGRERVADVFRAEAVRPIAEAWAVMGNAKKARWAYGKALTEGAHNPNSWPRSEDLADTLCSMAVRGIEPDEALWKQIRKIHAELGPPW